MAVTGTYTAADIQVLTGIQPVRKRPGMYIGGVGADGLHHMFLEVLGNAVDEHLRGFARNIHIAIDGHQISVEDDGRGIPPAAIEQLMTTLHAGTAAQPHVHLRAGLCGVGIAVVNALSSELEAVVWCNGNEHVQRFAFGEAVEPHAIRGKTTRTGTRITFTPDFSIMEKHAWDVERIQTRCRQLAALTPPLAIAVDKESYRYVGLVEYVTELAACDVIEPFHCRAEQDGVRVDIAIARGRRGRCECYVNCSPCTEGVHVDALRAALRTVCSARLPGVRMSRLDRRLVVVLHVQLDHPRFGQPTRSWLENPEAGAIVREVVERELARHFDENPALLDQMLLDLQRPTRSGRSAPSPKRSARGRSRTPRARAKAGSAAK